MHAESLVTRSHETAAVPTQRLRVLLVEDSQRLAASIRDYLERHNYEVITAKDGVVGIMGNHDYWCDPLGRATVSRQVLRDRDLL